MLARFNRIFDRVIGGFMGGASILIAYMVLAITLEVISRYFVRKPILGLLETVDYTMLWVPFLGAAWLLNQEEHVLIDTFLNRLRQRDRALVNCITSVIGVITLGIITWFSTLINVEWFQKGIITSTTVRYLEAPIIIVIPLGSLAMFIEFLRRTVRYFMEWRSLQVRES